MTAEQLLDISSEGRSELVRGELVKMSPVGRVHGRLVVRLLSWLGSFVAEREAGEVFTEVGFILSRDPDTVRAPDVSFMSTARLGAPDDDGFYEGAPDLAIEVLSPDDRPGKVQEKIREYLAAGTRQVWIVDADDRTITVYLPSGASRSYSGMEEVSGSDLLRGFSFRPGSAPR